MRVPGDEYVQGWLLKMRQLLARETGVDVSQIHLRIGQWESPQSEDRELMEKLLRVEPEGRVKQ